MVVAWKKSPIMAAEIVDTLTRQKSWSSRTIRTLLDRLVKKKALKNEPKSSPHLYKPLISMKEATRQESQSFLQRVFGGEASAMLLHLVDEAHLSPEEIEKLKDILLKK